MTPVLCLNCGKARSKHYVNLLVQDTMYCNKRCGSQWRDKPEVVKQTPLWRPGDKP